MRRKIVAGNWKMNLDFQEAQDLVENIANLCEDKQPDCDIVICPPYLYLEMVTDMADDTQLFYVGAQNVNENESGAFNQLPLLKPYSFVLVDEEKETIADLLLMDDDTMLLSEGLFQGLDEELDAFLKDLLEN